VQTSPKKQHTRKGKEKATTALETTAPNTMAPNEMAPNLTAPNDMAPKTALLISMSAATGTFQDADAPMTIIDQGSMMVLVAQGYLSVPLLNGPNDGDPQYTVPMAALRRLNLQAVPSRLDAE